MLGLKVGVLTFHRCINYGSYWQARCLVDGLRARGLDAVLLDHGSRRVNVAEWKCGFRPTLPTPVPRSDRAYYREKMRKFFSCFEELPLSAKFCLDSADEIERYDVIVIGSDEVWNLLHPWYGQYGIFYGDGLNAGRLVSYAASFGNYPVSYGLGQPWTDWLRNFKAISVRDENSQAIVRNTLALEPEIVLDPCLQFPLDPKPRDRMMAERPYAAVYGHNFSAPFQENIHIWARRRNLSLISIGYRNEWADYQWIAADPHDFAHFVAGAEAVVTNFFHGAVFALRNGKPFACEASEYRANKLNGLAVVLGVEQNLLSGNAPFQRYTEVLDSPASSQVTKRLTSMQERTERYLSIALPVQI